mmetsp:Transcript_70644/g.187893  ORF Transcript_70644/g.187893 Transcript_70644/m.187893 type:complete len:211 (-) Transcript_70644:190-822(-)
MAARRLARALRRLASRVRPVEPLAPLGHDAARVLGAALGGGRPRVRAGRRLAAVARRLLRAAALHLLHAPLQRHDARVRHLHRRPGRRRRQRQGRHRLLARASRRLPLEPQDALWLGRRPAALLRDPPRRELPLAPALRRHARRHAPPLGHPLDARSPPRRVPRHLARRPARGRVGASLRLGLPAAVQRARHARRQDPRVHAAPRRRAAS